MIARAAHRNVAILPDGDDCRAAGRFVPDVRECCGYDVPIKATGD